MIPIRFDVTMRLSYLFVRKKETVSLRHNTPVLYCTVLYCTVLYCTVLYHYAVTKRSSPSPVSKTFSFPTPFDDNIVNIIANPFIIDYTLNII